MLANKTIHFNVPGVSDQQMEALREGAKEIEALKAELDELKSRVPIPEHVLRRMEQEKRIDQHVQETRREFNKLPSF